MSITVIECVVYQVTTEHSLELAYSHFPSYYARVNFRSTVLFCKCERKKDRIAPMISRQKIEKMIQNFNFITGNEDEFCFIKLCSSYGKQKTAQMLLPFLHTFPALWVDFSFLKLFSRARSLSHLHPYVNQRTKQTTIKALYLMFSCRNTYMKNINITFKSLISDLGRYPI